MSAFHALFMLAQLGSPALAVADRDIPYFEKNPAVMRETLRKCHEGVTTRTVRRCTTQKNQQAT